MSTSRRVTLTDVATAAGVSRMTASYAYNQPSRVADRTRQRVMDAAQRLGYRGPDPSGRFLRQGSLRSLGLVLGESLTCVFDDPQATAFVAGLAQECATRAYGLTIIPTTGGSDDTKRIAAAAVDGFVVWTTTADDPALEAVRDTHRRAVIHGGPRLDDFAMVGIDNRAAAAALASSVWRTSRTPAVLSFPLDRARSPGVHHGLEPQAVRFPVTRDRLDGFQDAARHLGINWAEIPVAVCSLNDATQARAATQALHASRQQLDGLVTMSDQQALGARVALLDAGRRIPEDVTLGGFDDSPEARSADLTSIHQSMRDQGARSARLALDAPTEPENQDAWHLVERHSTHR